MNNYLFLVALILVPLQGQSQFILSAEIRPRAEVRHGYRTLSPADVGSAKFISQRSRLNLDYTKTKLRTKLSIQDIRVWGSESQLRDEPSIALHEAWVELDLNENLRLKLGRQELIYDDHRLLGSVNWVQQARSHDALVFKAKINDSKIHLGLAYNNEGEALTDTDFGLANYRSLAYLWFNHSFDKHLNLSILSIADGLEGDDHTTHYRLTSGTLLKFAKDKLALESSFFYQLGETTEDIDIGAFLFSFMGKYSVGKTGISLGIDILSGTNALDTDNSKVKSFNTLYATNHKFYGFMDYFLNVPNDTGGGGLNDVYIKLNTRLNDKSSLAVHGHYFMLANNVIDQTNPLRPLSKGLGTEIDAVYTHKFLPEANFNIGWSLLLPTDSLEKLRNVDNNGMQTWLWAMMTIKPIFYKSEPKKEL